MSESVFAPLVPPRIGDAPADPRGATEKARARGYADGFARGRRDAREERDRLVEQLRTDAVHRAAEAQLAVDTALAALDAARVELQASAAALVGMDAGRVELAAVELARVILDAELSDTARSAAHALRRAADAAPASTVVRVLLHPRDARTAGAGGDGIPIHPSDDVDPGGAIVELREGRVDARIDAALQRVRAALTADDGGGGLA
ncbi:FliH/SctL family protein [uncultured Microbacterium sp.]|uniref:FliH/SctL family protein n=1 Tax=uncultured Microbacterium sp. TaxID=191216 RepID=UPI0025D27D57|nr:FliH/SctL family protein [uncultured Microbacterium sp.]